MKFLVKTTILLATGLAPFLAAASPQQPFITFPFDLHHGEAKGAAYFMNNDPTGNYLFAADIGVDAKLTLRKAYFTGGKGGHATGTLNNALFSQGSVIASELRKVVILVNAGSNTLAVFQINPTDPSDMRLLGQPVYSGGDFPVSVAINEAGDMVCALNSGAQNGVSCFQLDSDRGLVPLPDTTRSLNLPQTGAIPNGPDLTASDLAFTEDGKKLAVAVKGVLNPRKPGYIGAWDINEDQSLSTEFTNMTGGAWIWSLTQVPGRNAFIGADVVTGIEIYDLDALVHNPSAHSQNLQVPGQIALCWSAYSEVTKNFYLVDFGVPSVDEIQLDTGLNGTIVAVHQLDLYDGASDLSINHVNGKDRLYLLASNSTSVEVFTIQGPGDLERIQKLNVGLLINEIGLQFDPANNYGIATYVV